MKSATAIALFLALALAGTVAAKSSRSDVLRAREHRLVRQVEQAKTTLRWFEKHPRIVYSKNPRVKAKAWHVIAVARQRVILGRAALKRTRATLVALRPRPRTVYEIARAEAFRLGVRGHVWGCLAALVNRENAEPPATWNPRKWNGRGSGAYGLPQALPGGKMRSEGSDWAWNPATQIRWMIRYSKDRYGGVCEANAHQLAVRSY